MQAFEQKTITITIFDIFGKIVFSQIQNAVLGANQVMLDIDNLQEACYFVQVDNGQERIIEKLTIL